MIVIAISLFATVAFGAVFLSGALSEPDPASNTRLYVGLVGTIVSVVTLGGSIVAVLP